MKRNTQASRQTGWQIRLNREEEHRGAKTQQTDAYKRENTWTINAPANQLIKHR